MRIKNYALIFIVLFLVSCSTKNVSLVVYDYNQKKSTYYINKNDTLTPDKLSVKEGSSILINVKNYNPLAHEFTVQQNPDILYYVSAANQSKTLIDFVGTNSIVTEPPSSVGAAIQTKIPKKCELVDDINEEEVSLSNNINEFNNFFSAIVNLNSLIEMYKKQPSLERNSFFCDIDKAVNNVKLHYYNDGVENTIEDIVCDEDNYTFISYLEGDNIIMVNQAYLNYFQKSMGRINEGLVKFNENKCNSSQLNSSLKKTLVDTEQLISDINSKITINIGTVVSSLKSLKSLRFKTSLGSFKAGETDELVLKLSVKNNIDGSVVVLPLADIPVSKAIKVDYSAGIFFSGLYDETYRKSVTVTMDNSVDPAVDKKEYNIHKLDGGATSFGAMGYINFHSQLNQAVNYGGSLGAGLLFNKSSKLVLSPTFSLFIGKYQRLIIHVGAAFAQVDRIYSIYGENTYTDTEYVPDTKSITQASFLFGISWNLSRK